MVVVADAAIQAGRRAGLRTVAGVGSANASMALASALGLSALFGRVPEVIRVVAAVGALYLAWLGIQAIVRGVNGERTIRGSNISSVVARRPTTVVRGATDNGPPVPDDDGVAVAKGAATPVRGTGASWFVRGLITNYSNPSVVLFYTVLVPQFITPREPFVPRYLLLGGTHVAMSVVWLTAFAISVGTLAAYMKRPRVRRTMDLAMGATLLAFAAKIAVT